MNYRTLTAIITFALLLLVIALFVFPTPGFFMVSSALVPVLIGVLAVGVVRAPEQGKERETEKDWYDSF